MREYILVINPGSTSTKIGVFKDKQLIESKKISYDAKDLMKYERVNDQLAFRLDGILKALSEGYDLNTFRCVVGRGGFLKPISSGTYLVSDEMLKDLKQASVADHAANLGGQLAALLAEMAGTDSYVVDPTVVDEIEDIARISGLPQIERKSFVHALNIRSVAARVAQEQDFDLSRENVIVAHMGGGSSLCAMKNGKMIDVVNGMDEGAFTPNRTGALPVVQLAKLACSGRYSFAELRAIMTNQGGLIAYLGTNDCKEVTDRIIAGDKKAALIMDAMAYQLSKEIASMAAVLEGRVRCIILTGGVAYTERITAEIERRVRFIAPVIIEPGEDELSALNEGALMVLSGGVKAKIYEDELKRPNRWKGLDEEYL